MILSVLSPVFLVAGLSLLVWGIFDYARWHLLVLGIFFPMNLLFPDSRAFQKPEVDEFEGWRRTRMLLFGLLRMFIGLMLIVLSQMPSPT